MEKKKKIKIIVEGETASGKSTIVDVLHEFLRMNLFDVEISMDNNPDYLDLSDFKEKMRNSNRKERINVVTKTTKLVLIEKQIHSQPEE